MLCLPFIAKLSQTGVWRSLVAHFLREEGVGGSNPLTPTKFTIKINILKNIF